MSVTLKEIASMAGVHKSTVDKVIHNRPGVSDATRAKVRALLDAHGYETNPLAKALNFQKNKQKIAIILPETDALPALREGMQLLEQDFKSFNCEVCYYNIPYPNVGAQARCLECALEEQVAGVIIQPMEGAEITNALQKLAQSGIPVIAVNSLPPNTPHTCFVGGDMAQSGRIAARILAALLDKNASIGMVSSSAALCAVKQRETAFVSYFHKIAPSIRIAEIADAPELPEILYAKTTALLAQHRDLDALVITCGCVGAICNAVRDANLHHTPKIICYERYTDIQAMLNRGIVTCTISANIAEQGRLAMRLLFEHIFYGKAPTQQVYYTQNDIIIRETLS